MKKIRSGIMIALLAALAFSCNSTIETMNTGTSLVTISLNTGSMTASADVRQATLWAKLKQAFAQLSFVPSARAAIPSGVKTVSVTVTAADMSPITNSVNVSGLPDVSITIEVPNGLARNFLLEAFGSSGGLSYSGSASADITGAPLTLTVDMTYVGALIYVTNSGGNTVSVINPATDTVITMIPVGTNPYGVAVNPATNKAYVANFGSSDVSVIDVASNTVIDTVSLMSATPYGIAVNSNNNKIYITDKYNGPDVYSINGTDNSTGILSIAGSYSYGVAVNPNTNIAYVSDWGWVNKIDTNTDLVVGSSIGISGANESISGVAIDPSMSITIVTDNQSGDLNFIDAADAVTTVSAAGVSLEGVTIDTSTHVAYIADSGANSVLVYDIAARSLLTSISVGSAPVGIASYSPAKKIYVANSGDNTVSVIDANSNTVVNTITVGTNPLGVAVSK